MAGSGGTQTWVPILFLPPATYAPMLPMASWHLTRARQHCTKTVSLVKTQAGLPRRHNCPVSPRTSSNGADFRGDESTRGKGSISSHGRTSRWRQMAGASAQWGGPLITTLNFPMHSDTKCKLILTLLLLNSLHTM